MTQPKNQTEINEQKRIQKLPTFEEATKGRDPHKNFTCDVRVEKLDREAYFKNPKRLLEKAPFKARDPQ